jgi:Bacterial SH3 domain
MHYSPKSLLLLLIISGLLLSTSAWRTPDPVEVEPYFTLSSSVENLRLRTTPGPDGKVIGTLPLHTQMHYLGQTAGPETEVVLRGVARRGRWLQVRIIDAERHEAVYNQTGWVFAGAVTIDRIDVSMYDTTFRVENLNADFFKVKKISQAEHQRYANLPIRDPLIPSPPTNEGDEVVVQLRNGERRKIAPQSCDMIEGGLDGHQYLGYYDQRGVFLTFEDCEHGEIYSTVWKIYSLENGQLLEGYDGLPNFSPNNQWSVAEVSADCGSFYSINFKRLAPNPSGVEQGDFIAELEDQSINEIVWAGDDRTIAVKWTSDATDEVGYYLITF